MQNSFTVEKALAAFETNQLGSWLDEYLTIFNVGLRDGLKKSPRLWSKPEPIALNSIRRCCGPEPELEYPMPVDEWNRRIAKMDATFETLDLFPPLIVMYQRGTLSIRDGNTRHELFRRRGLDHAWCLVWYNNPEDARAAGCTLEGLQKIPNE